MMPVFNSFRSPLRAAVLLLVAAALVQPCLMSQDKAAAQYTEEEYKMMEDIKAQGDAAQKTALVVKFFKAYPKSGLSEYVVADFVTAMSKLQAAGEWAALTNYCRQVVPFAPGNQYLTAYLAEGFRQTKNFKGFTEFGEQAYQKNPNEKLAYSLAKAFLEVGNDQKFIQWGETTVAKMPDAHDILVELVRKLSSMKQDAKADKYAKQCVKVLQGIAKPPEGTSEADWKKYTDYAYATCFYVIGYYGHQLGKYDIAVGNLENSIKFLKRNDGAYYLMGQSYWQLRRLDMAMKNFAKAYLLNGSTAVAAKQHLDNLYKQTHGNSLTGLDKVISKAQEELK